MLNNNKGCGSVPLIVYSQIWVTVQIELQGKKEILLENIIIVHTDT